MPPPSPPAFGKRNAPKPSLPVAMAQTPHVAAPDQAAIFAEGRPEIEADDIRPIVVPRSVFAALLAGLVVGFCLVGLDITRADASLSKVAGIAGVDTTRLLPVLILVALLGGARAAATILLIAHALLRRAGQTRHGAYALAGGAVAATFALAEIALTTSGLVDHTMMPGHGLLVETIAGAAAGFLYRVFAGSRMA